MLARPTGFEPASARSTIESSRLLSYDRAFAIAAVSITLLRAISERRLHAMVGVEGFEPSMLQRASGLRPGRASQSPQHTQYFGGEGASRTRKPRRNIPPRTGWAFQMPNATVAVGAGLEPAHASRREPRLRRGAMPFRSSYRLVKLAETIRFERMVPFKGTPR